MYLIKKEDKKKLLEIIIKDYTNNYYNSSYYINLDYKNAICNFNSLNAELIFFLNSELIYNKKGIFPILIKTYLQAKKNLRKLFDANILIMKLNYVNYKIKYPEKNIINYFESYENNIIYSQLQLLYKDQPKNNPLLLDTIYNYLKDKFEINSDEECSQLLMAVQDFLM